MTNQKTDMALLGALIGVAVILALTWSAPTVSTAAIIHNAPPISESHSLASDPPATTTTTMIQTAVTASSLPPQRLTVAATAAQPVKTYVKHMSAASVVPAPARQETAPLSVVVPRPWVSPAAVMPNAAIWACIRQHESGGNYAIDTGNGYYGAYQFSERTWLAIGGVGFPDDAAPAVQDAMALKLYSIAGWSPWPVTAQRCGA